MGVTNHLLTGMILQVDKRAFHGKLFTAHCGGQNPPIRRIGEAYGYRRLSESEARSRLAMGDDEGAKHQKGWMDG